MRRIEGAFLGGLPDEVIADAVLAPGRGVGVGIIERRAAVGEERGGHGGSVTLDKRVSNEGFLSGDRAGYGLLFTIRDQEPNEQRFVGYI